MLCRQDHRHYIYFVCITATRNGGEVLKNEKENVTQEGRQNCWQLSGYGCHWLWFQSLDQSWRGTHTSCNVYVPFVSQKELLLSFIMSSVRGLCKEKKNLSCQETQWKERFLVTALVCLKTRKKQASMSLMNCVHKTEYKTMKMVNQHFRWSSSLRSRRRVEAVSMFFFAIMFYIQFWL